MKAPIAAFGLVAVILAIWAFTGMNRSPLPPVADAGPLAPATLPKGEVVLTVNQEIDGQQQVLAYFDLPALQALPIASFETTTMWTDGLQKFEGVDLKIFLDSLGVATGTLIATAVNDYRIEIPVAEIEQGGPMIAYHVNGSPMSVRDKGPLWIVYPYDANPKYQTEVVFSRSIWQMNRLEVAP